MVREVSRLLGTVEPFHDTHCSAAVSALELHVDAVGKDKTLKSSKIEPLEGRITK